MTEIFASVMANIGELRAAGLARGVEGGAGVCGSRPRPLVLTWDFTPEGRRQGGRAGAGEAWPSLSSSPWIRWYPPAVILGREPFDQRGDLAANRRPSRPVRVVHLRAISGGATAAQCQG